MFAEASTGRASAWAMSVQGESSAPELPQSDPAPKPVWWHLYSDEGGRKSPRWSPTDQELDRRAPTDAEATGRRILLRAAFTAGIGGAIISLFSFAFGPRFFVADVRALGILSGLVIIALACVAPIGAESRKTALGALIIVAAVVAFPIAAGGYFVGSIVAVIGGALLVAYEPPSDEVEVVVRPAGRIRRFVALAVDFVAAFALHRLLFAVVPSFFSTTVNVLVAWAFCWMIISVVPTIWTRRTLGRILVVLRLADPHTADRADPMSVLARELLRGVIAIGGFFLVLRVALGDELRVVPAMLAVVALALVGFAIERFRVMDELTGAVSVYDSFESPQR